MAAWSVIPAWLRLMAGGRADPTTPNTPTPDESALNLVEVWPRVFAAGMPWAGPTSNGALRNNLDELATHLTRLHGRGNFAVVNLAPSEHDHDDDTERLRYDPAHLGGQVLTFEPAITEDAVLRRDDGLALVGELFRIAMTIDFWLSWDPKHVVVVHGYASPARPAAVIAAYVHWKHPSVHMDVISALNAILVAWVPRRRLTLSRSWRGNLLAFNTLCQQGAPAAPRTHVFSHLLAELQGRGVEAWEADDVRLEVWVDATEVWDSETVAPSDFVWSAGSLKAVLRLPVTGDVTLLLFHYTRAPPPTPAHDGAGGGSGGGGGDGGDDPVDVEAGDAAAVADAHRVRRLVLRYAFNTNAMPSDAIPISPDAVDFFVRQDVVATKPFSMTMVLGRGDADGAGGGGAPPGRHEGEWDFARAVNLSPRGRLAPLAGLYYFTDAHAVFPELASVQHLVAETGAHPRLATAALQVALRDVDAARALLLRPLVARLQAQLLRRPSLLALGDDVLDGDEPSLEGVEGGDDGGDGAAVVEARVAPPTAAACASDGGRGGTPRSAAPAAVASPVTASPVDSIVLPAIVTALASRLLQRSGGGGGGGGGGATPASRAPVSASAAGSPATSGAPWAHFARHEECRRFLDTTLPVMVPLIEAALAARRRGPPRSGRGGGGAGFGPPAPRRGSDAAEALASDGAAGAPPLSSVSSASPSAPSVSAALRPVIAAIAASPSPPLFLAALQLATAARVAERQQLHAWGLPLAFNDGRAGAIGSSSSSGSGSGSSVSSGGTGESLDVRVTTGPATGEGKSSLRGRPAPAPTLTSTTDVRLHGWQDALATLDSMTVAQLLGDLARLGSGGDDDEEEEDDDDDEAAGVVEDGTGRGGGLAAGAGVGAGVKACELPTADGASKRAPSASGAQSAGASLPPSPAADASGSGADMDSLSLSLSARVPRRRREGSFGVGELGAAAATAHPALPASATAPASGTPASWLADTIGSVVSAVLDTVAPAPAGGSAPGEPPPGARRRSGAAFLPLLGVGGAPPSPTAATTITGAAAPPTPVSARAQQSEPRRPSTTTRTPMAGGASNAGGVVDADAVERRRAASVQTIAAILTMDPRLAPILDVLVQEVSPFLLAARAEHDGARSSGRARRRSDGGLELAVARAPPHATTNSTPHSASSSSSLLRGAGVSVPSPSGTGASGLSLPPPRARIAGFRATGGGGGGTVSDAAGSAFPGASHGSEPRPLLATDAAPSTSEAGVGGAVVPTVSFAVFLGGGGRSPQRPPTSTPAGGCSLVAADGATQAREATSTPVVTALRGTSDSHVRADAGVGAAANVAPLAALPAPPAGLAALLAARRPQPPSSPPRTGSAGAPAAAPAAASTGPVAEPPPPSGAAAEPGAPSAADAVAKYTRMLRMGVPRPAVIVRMRADGLDPLLLDADAAAGGLGAAPTAAAGEPAAPAPPASPAPPAPMDEATAAAVARYGRMLKMGIPAEAVRHKMRGDGVANVSAVARALGIADDEGGSSGGSVAAAAVARPQAAAAAPSAADAAAASRRVSEDAAAQLAAARAERIRQLRQEQADLVADAREPLATHKIFGRWFRMLAVGVPRDVVTARMATAGLDPSVLALPPDAPPPPVEFVPLRDDGTYGRFLRMLKVGLPRDAVQHKMAAEGANDLALDLDPELPAPPGLNDKTPLLALSRVGPLAPAHAPPRPKRQRKRWHWDAVPADRVAGSGATIWTTSDVGAGDGCSGGDAPPPSHVAFGDLIDDDEFDALFTQEVAGGGGDAAGGAGGGGTLRKARGGGGSTGASPSSPGARGRNQYLTGDMKRERNVGIGLAKLRVPPEAVRDCLLALRHTTTVAASVRLAAPPPPPAAVGAATSPPDVTAAAPGTAAAPPLAAMPAPPPGAPATVSLSPEQLALLEELLPNPDSDELVRAKAFRGDRSRLSEASRFWVVLADVPKARARAAAIAYQLLFDARVAEVDARVRLLVSACEQVRGSGRLKRLLLAVRQLGNKLNAPDNGGGGGGGGGAPTTRAPAAPGGPGPAVLAFRLDSLLKLAQTKAFDGRTTALRYLAALLARKDPDVLRVGEDVPGVGDAARLTLEAIRGDVGALRAGLQTAERLVREEARAGGGGSGGTPESAGAGGAARPPLASVGSRRRGELGGAWDGGGAGGARTRDAHAPVAATPHGEPAASATSSSSGAAAAGEGPAPLEPGSGAPAPAALAPPPAAGSAPVSPLTVAAGTAADEPMSAFVARAQAQLADLSAAEDAGRAAFASLLAYLSEEPSMTPEALFSLLCQFLAALRRAAAEAAEEEGRRSSPERRAASASPAGGAVRAAATPPRVPSAAPRLN